MINELKKNKFTIARKYECKRKNRTVVFDVSSFMGNPEYRDIWVAYKIITYFYISFVKGENVNSLLCNCKPFYILIQFFIFLIFFLLNTNNLSSYTLMFS